MVRQRWMRWAQYSRLWRSLNVRFFRLENAGFKVRAKKSAIHDTSDKGDMPELTIKPSGQTH